MLTANGKALCKINNVASRSNPTLKTIGGTDVGIGNLNNFMPSLKLYAGSNNTPVADTDYEFNNGNPDNLSLTVMTASGTNDGTIPSYTQNYIAIFSCTFRNNTENNIIVSEVGIMGIWNGAFILIARDVIDPVTIAPGEAYTFTMYIG